MLPILIGAILGIISLIVCWFPFYIFQIEKVPRYFLYLIYLIPAISVTGGPYITALFLKKDFSITSKFFPIPYALIGGFFSMATILLIYLSPVVREAGIAKFLSAILHNPVKFISLVMTSKMLLSQGIIFYLGGAFSTYMTIKTQTIKQIGEIRKVDKLQQQWKDELANNTNDNSTISRLLSKR